jgi:hypothetical protein
MNYPVVRERMGTAMVPEGLNFDQTSEMVK